MILGETKAARDERRLAQKVRDRQWRRTFAWFPERLADGRFVWLQPIEVRTEFFFDDPGDPYRSLMDHQVVRLPAD